MNHLDLFSGIGGFSLAAHWAGIETIAFCEKDKFCQKVLAKHWPDVIIYPDVKELDFTAKVDLLTAGFPCQPFSVAGSKKGVKDDRYLWPEVIRIIALCRPAWVILENVPGIIPMLDPILADLENQDYSWQAFLVPASSVGAPHKRERIWIIANSNGIGCHSGECDRKTRHFQANIEQHIKTIHQEWQQWFPQSWATFNAQEWLGFITNTDSERLGTPQHNQETTESCEKPEQLETGVSDREHATNTNRKHGDKGTTNKSRIGNSISKASCLQNRNVTGDSDSITGSQTNSESVSSCEKRKARPDLRGEFGGSSTELYWKESEPPVPGVDDGLSFVVDRNRALGNAIVPQVAYSFMRIIKLLHDNFTLDGTL